MPPDDPSVRVKTTWITPEGPKGQTESARGLRGIVGTIYKGDDYTKGPPYETFIVMHKKQEDYAKAWTREEAELNHANAVVLANHRVRPN